MLKHIVAIPLVLVAACSQGNSEPRENATQATRTFAVGAFEAVELAGSDDVRVVAGATVSVVASGRTDVLDRLDIRVEDGQLKIGRKRDKGWRVGWSDDDHNATVTVTTPLLRGASLAGSGDMTVDRGEAERFDVSLAGSGNLSIAALTAKRAKLSLAGSGDMRVAGRADDTEIALAGSGDIDAAGLVSARGDVSIAGSGNASIDAREAAQVSIIGSGNVTVTGTKNCKISKIGSGEVRCAG